MDKLRTFLNSMTPDQQEEFARRCGTTVGYLRKAISAKQKLGESLCINIDRESGGAVSVDVLCPSADWAHVRNSGPRAPAAA